MQSSLDDVGGVLEDWWDILLPRRVLRRLDDADRVLPWNRTTPRFSLGFNVSAVVCCDVDYNGECDAGEAIRPEPLISTVSPSTQEISVTPASPVTAATASPVTPNPGVDLTVFNYQGTYAANDVFDFFANAGLLGAGAGQCNATCNTSRDLGLATHLPSLIEDVYMSNRSRSGFIGLTAAIAHGMSTALSALGLDTSPGSPWSVEPCGVYLDDILNGSVNTTGFCDHDENCTCKATSGLCVMMTNISVISEPRPFQSRDLNVSTGDCNTTDAVWDKESIDVSFILVSNWFHTVFENAWINDEVTTALEASLCEADDNGSLMRQYVDDVDGVLEDLDGILYPNRTTRRFGFGFSSSDLVCDDADNDGGCDSCSASTGPDESGQITLPPLPGCQDGWIGCWWVWLAVGGVAFLTSLFAFLVWWHHHAANNRVLIYASEPPGAPFDVMMRSGAALAASDNPFSAAFAPNLYDEDDHELDLDLQTSLQDLAGAAPETRDFIDEMSDAIDAYATP